MSARREKVVIIGAGVGGLAAAIDLARQGLDVVVIDRASGPGGKLREAPVGDVRIDAGPTVLTLRKTFDDLFADAGASLDAFIQLQPLQILARHAWDGGGARLDLHADPYRAEQAIAAFAGASQARGYRKFRTRARDIFEALDKTYIRSSRPSPQELIKRAGVGGLIGLGKINPFATLWKDVGSYFSDPRLRQLFARYATYCGSSPFLAPATLMLVAHLEQSGVWTVDGGMYRLAEAMEALGRSLGVVYRYDAEAREIEAHRGAVTGVLLADGERLEAGAVVLNADVAALVAGLFGADPARGIGAPGQERSMSAVTWMIHGRTAGFPLTRHNVFFCADYKAEFDDIFGGGRLPRAPTIYVCAQDRFDSGVAPEGPERLFCLVNAPAVGDKARPSREEIERCQSSAFAMLERCGLRIDRQARISMAGPQEFARLFPATGGALYGQASHGWQASFTRPGSRTKIPGLYLAGGSVHPGAGLPTATLSGRLAARALIEDLASRAS
jgi:1-hydroxycarotenoid 3,4-desaturase